MRTHYHNCANYLHCGESWACSAGPVSDGDLNVCCQAEYDHPGPLLCEDCEAGTCQKCGAYPGQPHDQDCEGAA